ncbi:hypothetical protein I5907_12150 [Panacibacter sp. DH6]|uniref:Gingipain domain-containing protein n=1 Tax=Panacibacter microcysteis TaxID=2793269 RepID=A0A931E1N9_9BACT|nr:C25 family cysteine peptidase [Panacibacter microcysteis]MBG9376987.1 hypothetical protein [Panacibacter microcysteis]
MFACCVIAFVQQSNAQYNNEWIDYSKTYYKFKVGKTGLYRISQQTLSANLLGNVPAEQFQLWRNGKQVPIYTSVLTGVLPATGYIEFWGERNDGKPDKALYKNPSNQLSDVLSLETDTAVYFLTVNAATGSNLRIVNAVNNVAGNTLAPEPYLLYEYRQDYQQRLNWGRATYFGEYVYSSTYDVGEFWASNDVTQANALQLNAGNLYASTAAGVPAPSLKVSAAGNSVFDYNQQNSNLVRFVRVDLNNTKVIDKRLTQMSAAVFSNEAPIGQSLLNNTASNFTISIYNTSTNDRVAVGFVSLTYARRFHFGGAASFTFTLPASTQGNYLEIDANGFNSGGTAVPVLYDLTNTRRYTAISNSGFLKFALPPSATDRKLVLVSEDISNIQSVTALTSKTFVDFSNTANQADYIIVSNKRLQTGAESYKNYRGSAPGGGYNTKVFYIDELVDQFAYGIKMHPLAVKNFLGFARSRFTVTPKFALLIGKAVTYNEYRARESSVFDDQLNLVPTFGWPASDVLLASSDLNPVPATPIGRIAAISSDEVETYLSKIREYETRQQTGNQTVADKQWMKNMVHVTGANSDAGLDAALTAHLNEYRDTIQGPLYGGSVFSFNRVATGLETPYTQTLMANQFNNGLALLNYFGHSAATQLDYNLGEPTTFKNQGKYPVFLVNGCNAGNIYSYDTSRLTRITSLSEKFVLAKDLGSIAFIASTHFGVESYLHVYNQGFYESLSTVAGYNLPVSKNMKDAATYLLNVGFDSTTKYLHAEQNTLHGDPALKINAFAKPDFAVEESKVYVEPTFISVADNSFNIKSYFFNLGKAEGDMVRITIKWQHPDNTITTLVDKDIVAVRYMDSFAMTVPIIASRDVGSNKLIVSIDGPNKYTDEMSESNNLVTKTFFIYEDELKPVYPYNYSIVNKQNIKLIASTANPLSPVKQYAMEIDTTELFNSTLKRRENITSAGGVLEFNPGISFTDSTVYYWRVAPVPADGNYIWNKSSFVYLANSSYGYNQSHLYQHLKSATDRIYIDSNNRKWTFRQDTSLLTILHAIFGAGGGGSASPGDYQVQINGQTITASACLGHSVIFNIFDPITLKPYYNQANPSTSPSGTYGGFMGSYNLICNSSGGKTGTEYNFEFSYLDSVPGKAFGRRLIRDFMDWIPDGAIVTARQIFDEPFNAQPLVDHWINDANYFGQGNTAYARFKSAGFAGFDQYTYPRTWVFVYKKNDASLAPAWKLTDGLSDKIALQVNVPTPDTLGYITSPPFGPAAAWKQVKWRGSSLDSKAGDLATIDVIGVNNSGVETVLYNLSPSQQDFDISSVNVSSYPYIKLRMRNADSVNLTAYQLRYWRLLYDPVPEGALAPNILYNFKDTLSIGEQTNFQMAFKNVGDVPFTDSIKVDLTVYNASNVANQLAVSKLKKLAPGEVDTVKYTFDSKNFNGDNNLFLDVNPENDQPEQYHFNNFLYKKFKVTTDNFKPVMDVTFDGVHILNNDIVSSQPHVLIKVKDESKFLLLDDTTLCKVQLQYPDGSIRRFYFNTDTLRFTGATPTSADNTATIDFTPYLTSDGTYQLIVHAEDKTGNAAGGTDFTVSFMVYNKPMISNMFNYPNPFTTSTAFVFTITGSQVPQNLRIQVLTITGKIVKEITKQELGNLHVGRNITDYKWDGTDQYGQKLANGVYLYRVITNLNGNKLDKFPSFDQYGNEVDTDKYFNKGYGKMYLMR